MACVKALSQNLNDCIMRKTMKNLIQDRGDLVEILDGRGNHYIASTVRRSHGLLMTCVVTVAYCHVFCLCFRQSMGTCLCHMRTLHLTQS